MQNYHVFNNYHGSFIRPNIDMNYETDGQWHLTKAPPNVLTVEGMQFLAKMKFHFHTFNMFIGPPNTASQIHTDNFVQSYAINYVWGDSVSTMKWFKPLSDNYVSGATTAGSGYVIYEPDQVELIEEISFPINTCVLVRTDIPHQVINHTDTNRYCVSVRGNPVMNWDDALTHFTSDEFFLGRPRP